MIFKKVEKAGLRTGTANRGPRGAMRAGAADLRAAADVPGPSAEYDKRSGFATLYVKDKLPAGVYNNGKTKEGAAVEIIFDVMGSTLIAELFGELDHHAAEKIRERIDEALDSHGSCSLVFDFSGVTFMDSSGIGMVLGRYRKMSEAGDRIAIVSCSKTIRNILNMAGIFSVIDYFDTREEAVAVLGRKEVS